MFEFSVPAGDYDYDPETRTYTFKTLIFTENSWKQAKSSIKEFVDNGTTFTMIFMEKGESE